MDRLRAAALVVALIAVGAAAWAGGPYVNSLLKFGLTPPYGWVQTSVPDVVVVFTEPAGARSKPAAEPSRHESDREFLDRINKQLAKPVAGPSPFYATITVTAVQRPGLTLATYVKETRARANKVKGCAVLGEADRRLGGLPAVERTTRVTFASRPPIRTRQIMCQRDGRIFVIALAAPNAQYKKYSDDFDKTLASFVWR